MAIALTISALLWWIVATVRARQQGHPVWAGRHLSVICGTLLYIWTTNGFPHAYARSVFAVWVSQCMALLLLVPIFIAVAQPIELAKAAYGREHLLVRLSRSRMGHALSSPFLGPVLVPLLCVALFFGPTPGWAAGNEFVGSLILTLVAMAGLALMVPLLGTIEDGETSLIVGLALAVGLFELMIDAIPGMVLRLQATASSTFFSHRVSQPWSGSALSDQQNAGAVLWCAAELLDLPFVLLIFRRWIIADAMDAAAIDTVLDAEHAARAGLYPSGEQAHERQTPEADAPWWLSDQAMRERLNLRTPPS